MKREKVTPEWQQQTLENISQLDNVDLLQATLGLAGGDDYDGCMTERGEWEYQELQKELDSRLAKNGFYTPEQYQDLLDHQTEPYSEGLRAWYDNQNCLVNKYDPATDPFAARQYALGWNDANNANSPD